MKPIIIIGLLAVLITGSLSCTADEAVYIQSDSSEYYVIAFRNDGGYTVPSLDLTTGAIITIDTGHQEVHEGNAYTVSDTVSCNTTTIKWQIETLDSLEYAHLVFTLSSTGEALFLVTEGSDRDKGDDMNELNRRRIAPDAASVVVTRNPTGGTTDGVIVLFSTRSGITGVGSRSVEGGQARAISEWILKPATKYVVSITTYTNVYATMVLDWYEHEDATE